MCTQLCWSLEFRRLLKVRHLLFSSFLPCGFRSVLIFLQQQLSCFSHYFFAAFPSSPPLTVPLFLISFWKHTFFPYPSLTNIYYFAFILTVTILLLTLLRSAVYVCVCLSIHLTQQSGMTTTWGTKGPRTASAWGASSEQRDQRHWRRSTCQSSYQVTGFSSSVFPLTWRAGSSCHVTHKPHWAVLYVTSKLCVCVCPKSGNACCRFSSDARKPFSCSVWCHTDA